MIYKIKAEVDDWKRGVPSPLIPYARNLLQRAHEMELPEAAWLDLHLLIYAADDVLADDPRTLEDPL
ncbi:hypothetical protein ACSMXM_04920 [Pacificimonas sp. ICDLI1SI03]